MSSSLHMYSFHTLTRIITQQFPHQHDRSQFERFEQRHCRKGDISQRFILTPTTQQVRYRRQAIIVDYRTTRPSGLKVEEEHSRHDECPESIGKYECIGVGEIFSSQTWITTGEHSFLKRERDRERGEQSMLREREGLVSSCKRESTRQQIEQHFQNKFHFSYLQQPPRNKCQIQHNGTNRQIGIHTLP